MPITPNVSFVQRMHSGSLHSYYPNGNPYNWCEELQNWHILSDLVLGPTRVVQLASQIAKFCVECVSQLQSQVAS